MVAGWPIILESAELLFRKEEREFLEGQFDSVLDPADFVYRILLDLRESFVELLIHRKNERLENGYFVGKPFPHGNRYLRYGR